MRQIRSIAARRLAGLGKTIADCCDGPVAGLGAKWQAEILASAEPVVVTRHPALIDLLIERGIIGCNQTVITHATVNDVRGKHVIGVVPLSLARHAARVTEIPLDLAPADRGIELSLDRLREVAGQAVTYTVRIAE